MNEFNTTVVNIGKTARGENRVVKNQLEKLFDDNVVYI